MNYAKEIADTLEQQNKEFQDFKARCFSRIELLERSQGEKAGPAPFVLTPEHRKFRSALRKIVSGDPKEMKSMATDSGPDGGFMVVPHYSPTLLSKIFDVGAMRRIARIETMSSGNTFVEIADFGENDTSWVGEREARTPNATPQIGRLEVPIWELTTLQTATQQMLDDAMFDVGAWLDTKITLKMGRAENTAFWTGDGVKKPLGLLSAPRSTANDATRPWGTLQTVKSGAATSVTADALHDMVWSLRVPYRPGAVWTMNSNTAAAIDKLKDNYGEYLWRDSIRDGAPATLLGHEVHLDEMMPDLSAGSVSIAFGNFQLGYVVVDRVGLRFLTDPYTNKPNIITYVTRRVGGAPANTEAIKLMLTSA